MDEYGCCRLEDVDHLALCLKEKGTITFSYSADQFTAYVITITGPIFPIGTMPFGGNPAGMYGVGVLWRGFDHFDLWGPNEITEYSLRKFKDVGEYEARDISELLENIRLRLRECA
jgi:hypothetical protein